MTVYKDDLYDKGFFSTIFEAFSFWPWKHQMESANANEQILSVRSWLFAPFVRYRKPYFNAFLKDVVLSPSSLLKVPLQA